MNGDRLLSWEKVEGEPFSAHGYTVTPQAQALHIRLPFGGIVWNRPVAVVVDSDTGQQRIQIVDVTRVAQIALFAIALVASIASLLMKK
jgi:hypothetical protein